MAFAHDAGLEAAILDAPLDPAPRMVYADWLQAAGDPRGEWMALAAAIEADPASVRLRSIAVDFLGRHTELLLGGGRALLRGAWIGWRGGFIDELRVQPYDNQPGASALAALLAHPSSRFVRHLALGRFPDVTDALATMVDASLPLLETVVVRDSRREYGRVNADALAGLPRLQRLGMIGIALSVPLPQLRELTCALLEADTAAWIAGGGCREVVELTIDCLGVDAPTTRIVEVVNALPQLRRLRLLDLSDADAVVAELRRLVPRLELLDVSYSTLSDAGAAIMVAWPNLRAVALRTAVSEAMAKQLGVASRASRRQRLDSDLEEDAGTWLHHRLAAEGRDALRAFPGIGEILFVIGTRHAIENRADLAVPLLDANLTFPTARANTRTWANAAITHERRMELDWAELIAREGLLREPREPNFYAIVVDALRRSNRLADALAELPRALATLGGKGVTDPHVGGRTACLADCLLVLQQAGRHAEALALAKKHARYVVPRIHASIAMSQVALGKLEAARASMKLAKAATEPIHDHAKAVLALAGKRPNVAVALAALARVKAADYPEWHWIATDPNLARLADTAEFRALLAQ